MKFWSIAILLTLFSAPPASAADPIELFQSNGVPIEYYEESLAGLVVGDELQFSDGSLYKLLSTCKSGGSTCVFEVMRLKPNTAKEPTVIRLEKHARGYTSGYAQTLKQYIAGYNSLAEEKTAPIPEMKASSVEYAEMEKVKYDFTFEEFFTNPDKVGADYELARRGLKDFASELAVFVQIGDFGHDQVVFDSENKKWKLLDWGMGHKKIEFKEGYIVRESTLFDSTRDFYKIMLNTLKSKGVSPLKFEVEVSKMAQAVRDRRTQLHQEFVRQQKILNTPVKENRPAKELLAEINDPALTPKAREKAAQLLVSYFYTFPEPSLNKDKVTEKVSSIDWRKSYNPNEFWTEVRAKVVFNGRFAQDCNASLERIVTSEKKQADFRLIALSLMTKNQDKALPNLRADLASENEVTRARAVEGFGLIPKLTREDQALLLKHLETDTPAIKYLVYESLKNTRISDEQLVQTVKRLRDHGEGLSQDAAYGLLLKNERVARKQNTPLFLEGCLGSKFLE